MKSPYPIKHRWLAGLALLAAQTLPAALLAATSENTPAPRWETRHSFEQLGWNADSLLLGIRSSDQVEFRLRGDLWPPPRNCTWNTPPRRRCWPASPMCASTSTMR